MQPKDWMLKRVVSLLVSSVQVSELLFCIWDEGIPGVVSRPHMFYDLLLSHRHKQCVRPNANSEHRMNQE